MKEVLQILPGGLLIRKCLKKRLPTRNKLNINNLGQSLFSRFSVAFQYKKRLTDKPVFTKTRKNKKATIKKTQKRLKNDYINNLIVNALSCFSRFFHDFFKISIRGTMCIGMVRHHPAYRYCRPHRCLQAPIYIKYKI